MSTQTTTVPKIEMSVYECPRCGDYSTDWLFAINNHLKNCKTFFAPFSCENDLETYECENCNYGNSFKIDHLKHVNLNNCIYSVGEGELKEHEEFMCDRCNFTTFSEYFFEAHRSEICCWSTITSDAKIKCKVCDKVVTSKSKLKSHVFNEHSSFVNVKTLFRCSYCPYTTFYIYNLKSHLILHSKPDQIIWLECTHCCYKSKTESQLIHHGLKCHTENGRQLSCTQCQFKTVWRRNLTRHIKSNHQPADLTYKCDYCSFTSKWKNSIKVHINAKHLDPAKIDWFSCEICTYKAKKKGHITEHMKSVHRPTDENEFYKCDHCDYKSKFKININSHIKQHKSSKVKKQREVLQCDKCPYKSDRKNYLKKHLSRKHSEQWYQCACCEYRTLYKRSLIRHYTCRHADSENITWHNCNYCSYKAKLKHILQRHVFRKHKAQL